MAILARFKVNFSILLISDIIPDYNKVIDLFPLVKSVYSNMGSMVVPQSELHFRQTSNLVTDMVQQRVMIQEPRLCDFDDWSSSLFHIRKAWRRYVYSCVKEILPIDPNLASHSQCSSQGVSNVWTWVWVIFWQLAHTTDRLQTSYDAVAQ